MFLFNVAKKDEDGSVKTFEFLKSLKRLLFRESSTRNKNISRSGWSLLCVCSIAQLNYITPVATRLACASAVILSGVSISALIVSIFIYNRKEEGGEEETEIIESEHEIFLNFINNDYDLFIDIYKNKTEDFFINESESFIGELKNVDKHKTYDLPYSYNPTLIFYYDDNSQSFHYYCQSDVSCKILNSVCRTYTIGNKCIQLFQDDEEIKYMKGVAAEERDISFSDTEIDDGNVDAASSNSATPIVPTNESEENEETNGFVNIFYSKKGKTRTDKLNDEQQYNTNKFFYKGSLDEYKKIFLKNKNDAKQTTYEEYLAQCLK